MERKDHWGDHSGRGKEALNMPGMLLEAVEDGEPQEIALND